jgi:hypothetical protein
VRFAGQRFGLRRRHQRADGRNVGVVALKVITHPDTEDITIELSARVYSVNEDQRSVLVIMRYVETIVGGSYIVMDALEAGAPVRQKHPLRADACRPSQPGARGTSGSGYRRVEWARRSELNDVRIHSDLTIGQSAGAARKQRRRNQEACAGPHGSEVIERPCTRVLRHIRSDGRDRCDDLHKIGLAARTQASNVCLKADDKGGPVREVDYSVMPGWPPRRRVLIKPPLWRR